MVMKRLRRAAGKTEVEAGAGSRGGLGARPGGGSSSSSSMPRALSTDVISRFVVGAMRYRVELEEEEETFTKTTAALRTARRFYPTPPLWEGAQATFPDSCKRQGKMPSAPYAASTHKSRSRVPSQIPKPHPCPRLDPPCSQFTLPFSELS